MMGLEIIITGLLISYCYCVDLIRICHLLEVVLNGNAKESGFLFVQELLIPRSSRASQGQ
jgi:hypothetical protein